jgi:hypothetical protein
MLLAHELHVPGKTNDSKECNEYNAQQLVLIHGIAASCVSAEKSLE